MLSAPFIFDFDFYFNTPTSVRVIEMNGRPVLMILKLELAIGNIQRKLRLAHHLFTIDEMIAWVAAIWWPIRNKANEKLHPIIDINSKNKWPQTMHKRYNYLH